jgi:hypothetical protein
MTRTNALPAWTRLVALFAAFFAGTIAYAQAPQPEPDDPPVRVGRMSFANGEVSYAPAGSDEWVQAQVNRPIVTGDQLWADTNSRAELSVDNSSWWLGEQTSVTVSNLDDRIAQFQLQQGTLEFRVRRLPDGNIVEVDTPNLAFTVSRPGQYRVVVDPQDGATTVSVRSGGADVYGEGASYAVASGQSYRFYGTDLRDSELASLPPPDAFDRFVAERDRRYERNVSVRYVSPEVVGYEDLDTYGTWSAQPTYGNVWFPRTVRSGWAPYREGHWAWIDPWGWTWVDDEPWGFAPFHYGRWAYFDRGWGWVPGPRTIRPVYAPALVAFVGGSGFSISVSSGPAIGWFPLGSARRLSAAVSREQQLLPPGQRQQYGDQPGQHHQRLQQLSDEHERHAGQLREHARAQRRHGGAAGCVRTIAERGPRRGRAAGSGNCRSTGSAGCPRGARAYRVRRCRTGCAIQAAGRVRSASDGRTCRSSAGARARCAEAAGTGKESRPAVVAARVAATAADSAGPGSHRQGRGAGEARCDGCAARAACG